MCPLSRLQLTATLSNATITLYPSAGNPSEVIEYEEMDIDFNFGQ